MKNPFRGIWDFLTGKTVTNSVKSFSERVARFDQYAKYLYCYRGYVFRGNNSGTTYTYVSNEQMKRLVFNFAVPICNTGAAWLAGPEIKFTVTTRPPEGESDEDREARMDQDRLWSAQLDAIWDRSGSNNEFMDAALTCSVYGDCAITVRRENGLARLAFHEPGICDPYFSAHDARVLEGMTICYPIESPDGDTVAYVEEWKRGLVEKTEGDGPTETTVLAWAGDDCPALWVRNEAVKGREFGVSDIDAPYQAMLEYDHLAGKLTRIIDYYAAPSIVVKSANPNDTLDKNIKTVFNVSTDGDVYFLEWKGAAPGIAEHLELIRRGISEMTEIPEVAFGKVDSGFTHASGVSMKVLYGPLENKTRRKRAQWGPALERAMWLALRAEGVTDVPLESINIAWGECAPHSETEFLTDLETKMRLGISSKQALRELGYTEDQIRATMDEREDEDESKAELEMKISAAGKPPVTGSKEVTDDSSGTEDS